MRNRIALLPMTVALSDLDGSVSERQLRFLETRARSGAGLVMTEGATVHPVGRGWDYQFAAHDDRYLPGLERLATAIKRHGALAWLQLIHCGRRTLSSIVGRQPLAPSPIPFPGRSCEVPKGMTRAEVDEQIDAFVAAIARARRTAWSCTGRTGPSSTISSRR
jgi:2,4-dienoyl-CoA reductase-like NADH-dependent reductase (Old Yellow Enzyme family)